MMDTRYYRRFRIYFPYVTSICVLGISGCIDPPDPTPSRATPTPDAPPSTLSPEPTPESPEPSLDPDQDHDGVPDAQDCNPESGTSYPGATEICDGLDNDCDGSTDEGLTRDYYYDGDHDGYGLSSAIQASCSIPADYVATAGDCNDENVEIHPGATEACNGLDDDCDSVIDESVTFRTWYEDHDSDLYGNPAVFLTDCQQPSGYVADNTDCNDLVASTNPAAPEQCNNVDDDCDKVVDDNISDLTWYVDADSDQYGNSNSTVINCRQPDGNYVLLAGDCNDQNSAINPAAYEACNGIDDDCDGTTDEGITPTTWYADTDSDGYGDPNNSQGACLQPDGYVSNASDCNDTDPLQNPAAFEQCNGADDDCDAIIDEAVVYVAWHPDEDSDSYGNNAQTITDCKAPEGWIIDGSDCNDDDATIYPNAIEVCDSIDNDCDYTIDEGFDDDCQGDYDGDGLTVGEGDCDDTDPDNNPSADEICDSKDNNCDGQADEGLDCSYNPNSDYDHDGYTVEEGDCDDYDPTSYPGSSEICDLSDNDCDGEADESIEGYCTYNESQYEDHDGDGISLSEGDCNDNDPESNPTAAEICDSMDNDCDGEADEGLTCSYDPNSDQDQDEYSINTGDCNDLDPSSYPDAVEVCDRLDNDCDGQADEGIEQECEYDEWQLEDHDGDGSSASEGDCDDSDPANSPTSVEVCDLQDNNCDGNADEGLTCSYDPTIDYDNDGFSVAQNDCNDTDATIYPGAEEICDLKDNDCNGIGDDNTDEPCSDMETPDPETTDADGDGVFASQDCNDHDASSYPSAPELCDQLDNDCDGSVDEGLECDYDGDGYSIEDGDCNDTDPQSFPGAGEVSDSQDNDCDGTADDGLSDIDLDQDIDQDGYTIGEGDCDDLNASNYPNAAEVCDYVDNDCDGFADEGFESNEACDPDDEDQDGWSVTQGDCDDSDGTTYPGAEEVCDLQDNDCDFSTQDEPSESCDYDGDGVTMAEGDCNDLDPATYPESVEVCDQADNDCDGQADESLPASCASTGASDIDSDGYSIEELDCDDQDALSYPGATELCDLKDNDCDGLADEELADYCDYGQESEGDVDGDGVSVEEGDCDDLDPTTQPGAEEMCDFSDNDCDGAYDEGISDSCDYDGDGTSIAEGDCNDLEPTSNPDAVEICDGQDNDCDGVADDAVSGDCNVDLQADYDGDGFSISEGDCDDTNPNTYPTAEESCDYQDNNCDGQADEGIPEGCDPGTAGDGDGDGWTVADGDCNDEDDTTHPGADEACDHADNDCDGFYDETEDGCDYDGDGIAAPEDCNDADSGTYPGADERCDGADNDCDSSADESTIDPCPTVDDPDSDQDGWTIGEGDCVDYDDSSYPGADELCDLSDNDCDGQADEDFPTGCGTNNGGTGGDDVDGDGYSSGDGDCNDHDAQTYPEADEVCDFVDNDCDGSVDEQLTGTCDYDGDGWTIETGDCDDTNPGSNPSADEICDGADNNCDGHADEGMGESCDYEQDFDYDGDGITVSEGDCNDTNAQTYPGADEICDLSDNDCNGQADDLESGSCSYTSDGGGDSDGDGWTRAEDCDDSDGAVYPGADELCDQQDNNCDGAADENIEGSCDYDQDGYSLDEGDCNDFDPQSYPGAAEVCNGRDDNCDGVADELLEPCSYNPTADYDQDSYTIEEGDCDDTNPDRHPNAVEMCNFVDDDCDGEADETYPDGCATVDPDDLDGDGYSVGQGDCDDQDPSSYPGAEEACDFTDNDCDGAIDNGVRDECDYDGDGVSISGGDCDDLNPNTYPAAPETCDGSDNNCDGVADEDLDANCPYSTSFDYDGDGFSIDAGDCDDNDSTVYPGAEELCDLQDNDCDGAPETDCTVVEPVDHDGDGWSYSDCNDNNNTVYPGAEELCDLLDNDCDGDIDEGATGSCDYDGDGWTQAEGDCSDLDASINPGATEVCDLLDNNCNGLIDEYFPTGCITGEDYDGDGWTTLEGDCNDLDAAINPGAVETCDGLDNNCNGLSDENIDGICDTSNDDLDNDGWTITEDCDDTRDVTYPGANELCDLLDNNCDGVADEGLSCVYSNDYDGDGWTIDDGDCDDNNASIYPGAYEACDGVDNDCDLEIDDGAAGNCDYDGDGWTANAGDCDPENPATYPGATEICDQQDNDCDWEVDEGLTATCDYDGDGVTVSAGDCNDFDPSVYPGAEEQCDLQDNDCDQIIDEGVSSTCDYDDDGTSEANGDCNDFDPTIYPGAEERCDDADNNCNGEVDEGYEGDCDQDLDGYATEDGDCNDYNADVYPGAVEICDFEDNDCDGEYNEGFGDECTIGIDYDGDGFIYPDDCNEGDSEVNPDADETCDLVDNNCDGYINEGLDTSCLLTADVDKDGYTLLQGDCNDYNDTVYPGAEELCDELDNDCDLEVDEASDVDCTPYQDEDQDGWTIGEGDCDDYDPTINPGAEELCNFRDDDCDGILGEYYDSDQDTYIICGGDCDEGNDQVYPGADEEWYDGVDSDCDGNENPDACVQPPEVYTVPITTGCQVDLSIRVAGLCEGYCDDEIRAVVEILNYGSQTSPANVNVAVYGVTVEGYYSLVKVFSVGAVAGGSTSGGIEVSLPEYLNLYYYPTLVFSVDNDGYGRGAVDECEEGNNRANALLENLDCPAPDVCEVPPPGYSVGTDESCTYTPPIGEFDPVFEWRISTFSTYTNYNGINMVPVVGNLTDDNGDYLIDDNDTPDIVVVTFDNNNRGGTSVIRAISGDGLEEHWAYYGIAGLSGVALGEADGDGVPEVFAINSSSDLVALTNTGVYKWTCDTSATTDSSPAIADLDGDGDGEILAGKTVCDHTGKPLFTTSLAHDQDTAFFLDVNQDGRMEIVSGKGVSNSDGSTRWSTAAGLYGAMANFDQDDYPELVSVDYSNGNVYLYDDNGTQMWSAEIDNGSSTQGGGPPTVADFDGDGAPEIGIAGYDYYSVFENFGTRGELKWSVKTHDHTSAFTGSSVYDLDGDGRAEVIYADEYDVWILDGETGETRGKFADHSSTTRYEYPVIADVDRDGHAEIVFGSDSYGGENWNGLSVIGDASNNWVTARSVWNQHTYHITNINDDLSLPTRETAHWIEGNNTFRQGGFGTYGAFAAPDVVPVQVEACNESCPTARVLFQVENQGNNTVEAGLAWRVYGETSSTKTLITLGTIDETILAGWACSTQEIILDYDQIKYFDRIVLSVDDDGSGGSQNECEEDNNTIVLSGICQ